jgi:ribonuclease-3
MSEELIVPYNINNILITEKDIKMLFAKYDMNIDVKNINIYRQALTHKSYVVSEYTNYNYYALKQIKDSMDPSIVDLMPESSERIEFFGDTVVKCVVAKYLYERYYKEDEGFLTKTKTKIENRKSLANFARKLGIDDYLIISKQNEEADNRNSDKFLEDAFEGFIGALLFDQGFEFCEKYLTKLLENENDCYVDYSEILYIDTNFKDKLQRFFHQNGWQHPLFEDISDEIINGKKIFTVAVFNDKNEITRAQESSKKKAEQKASMLALLKYGQLYPDQIVEDFD